MKASVLKNVVGFFLVFLHLFAGFLCFAWLKPHVEYDDFRLIILILTPVATLYAVAFVKDVIKTMNAPPASALKLPLNFAALAMIYALAFGVAVIYPIYEFRYTSDMSPNELKDQLALIEFFGGGILGLLIDELFGK